MSSIHFIGGEKGGVGKSLTARLLAQYMIDQQIPFLGFDTDRSHGALLRFYEGYASPVVLDRREAFDVVIEAATAEPGRRILVDLAAQTHEPLVQWMDEAGVIELAQELGIRLTYWHVMDAGKDSADLLGKLLERFGASLHYVLVRNQVRGSDFTVLEQSGLADKAAALGAQSITLKKLHEGVAHRIDTDSSSFWKAAQAESGALGLMDRQRLKMWLQSANREIASIAL